MAKKQRPSDKRGRLEAEPFSYRTSSDGKVFISWQNRQVMVLKGKDAERFQKRLEGTDARRAQMAMAKITGNFKVGNGR